MTSKSNCLCPEGWVSAVRLELIPRPENNGTILMGKVKNGASTVKFTASLKQAGKKETKKLEFYHAEADLKDTLYIGGSAEIGVKQAWKISAKHDKETQTAVYLLDAPFKAVAGDVLAVQFGKGAVGCARISVTPFANPEPMKSGADKELAKILASNSRKNRRIQSDIYLFSASTGDNDYAEFKKLYREVLDCRNGQSPTVVTEAWKPAETRVLARGNWQDKAGEVVQPATPHFLPAPANAEGRRLTRLDLAKWLVSRDNPLTARAVMNRTWKMFFGTGISAVVDDLGAQGEWPTHPELLDWLAVEFMDSGWDMKHMIKLMVMSATYRQSSNPSPQLHEMDPANKLLAAQSPRRLEGGDCRAPNNAAFYHIPVC